MSWDSRLWTKSEISEPVGKRNMHCLSTADSSILFYTKCRFDRFRMQQGATSILNISIYSPRLQTRIHFLQEISSKLTWGVLNQEAGGISPGGLIPFEEVIAHKLALWWVDLDVSCGQSQDEHRSNKHKEQDQTAGGGRWWGKKRTNKRYLLDLFTITYILWDLTRFCAPFFLAIKCLSPEWVTSNYFSH